MGCLPHRAGPGHDLQGGASPSLGHGQERSVTRNNLRRKLSTCRWGVGTGTTTAAAAAADATAITAAAAANANATTITVIVVALAAAAAV